MKSDEMEGGGTGGSGCAESARVQSAILHFLSEENSSSLPTLSSELKSHLASCGSCASLARALDPTLLFVPLGVSVASAPAEDDVRRVTEDVLAEVRRRARVSTPAPVRPLFSRRFLQAAALVALAAGLFGVQAFRRAGEPSAPSPSPAAASPAVVPEAEIAAARTSARPLIQDLKNPAARVYEFAAVSAKEPSVVFIADPHADL